MHFEFSLPSAAHSFPLLTSTLDFQNFVSSNLQEFEYLWPKLDLVFNGGCLGKTEESRLGSTVVDLSIEGQYKIIRDGCALSSVENVLRDKYGLLQRT